MNPEVTSLEVASEVLVQLRKEAERAAPFECCGLLLGRSGIIETIGPARNVHRTPETHFEIDPQALINAHRAARRGGPEVIGYYHSHPNGIALPSATDRSMAHGDGMAWAIIGSGEITFWRDEADGFRQLSAMRTFSM